MNAITQIVANKQKAAEQVSKQRAIIIDATRSLDNARSECTFSEQDKILIHDNLSRIHKNVHSLISWDDLEQSAALRSKLLSVFDIDRDIQSYYFNGDEVAAAKCTAYIEAKTAYTAALKQLMITKAELLLSLVNAGRWSLIKVSMKKLSNLRFNFGE